MTMSGRLATFGAPLLRDTLRRQVAALIGNLERELGASAAPDVDGLDTGPGGGTAR